MTVSDAVLMADRPTRPKCTRLRLMVWALLALGLCGLLAAAASTARPKNEQPGGRRSQFRFRALRSSLGPLDPVAPGAAAVAQEHAEQGDQGAGDGGGGGGDQLEQLAPEPERHTWLEFGAAQGEQAAAALGSKPPEHQQPGAAGAGPDGESCTASLSVRKVALMFLTTGPMPHEQLWAEWLAQAEGLLPLRSVAEPRAFCLRRCGNGTCTRECGGPAACSPLCAQALADLYSRPANASVLQRQHLFSLYVHAPPSWPGYPQGSLFDGTLIAQRLATVWGTHSLVMAEQRLLGAAVADPANDWFLLLSDTTVPLYPPQLLWQQLMADGRSKVNACPREDDSRDRYSRFMESANFKPEHWRKSSQWFMLNRRHAEMVLADHEVSMAFLRHCRSGYDPYLRRWRACVSDEHLIPSLLASLGEDNSTSCDVDDSTYLDWSGGGEHPRSFQAWEVNQGLVELMRTKQPGCGAGQQRRATAAAAAGFATLRDLTAPTAAARAAARAAGGQAVSNSEAGSMCHRTLAQALAEQGFRDPFPAARLAENCTLTARKLPASAASEVLALYRSYSAGLGVLPCAPEHAAAAPVAAEGRSDASSRPATAAFALQRKAAAGGGGASTAESMQQQ